MKYFIVLVALAGLFAVSVRAGAMQQPDCKPTSIPISVLNELSQPEDDAIDSETGDARWERARAIAERDREYSAVERQHDDEAYRVASHLINAQFNIAQVEIAQVVLHNVPRAMTDFNVAQGQLDGALQEASPKQRLPLECLWDQMQRVELVATLCHGQSRGEDRFQYERLKAALRREIRAISKLDGGQAPFTHPGVSAALSKLVLQCRPCSGW